MKKVQPKNDSTYIAIATIIGFTGIFTTIIKPWIGIPMVIIGAGILFFGYRASQSRPKQNIQIQTVSSAFEVDPSLNTTIGAMRVLEPLVVPAHPVGKPMNATKPEERAIANKLVATLRAGGIDVNAPVFYGANDREVSIREMVTEVSNVAQSHGKTEAQLIEKIPTIYEYFWVYVDEVCTRDGANGEAAIKSALANKCLVVAFPEQAFG
jgi:hypothetical protein